MCSFVLFEFLKLYPRCLIEYRNVFFVAINLININLKVGCLKIEWKKLKRKLKIILFFTLETKKITNNQSLSMICSGNHLKFDQTPQYEDQKGNVSFFMFCTY